MERRTAAAIAGLLGLACAVLVLSVALPVGASPVDDAPGDADPVAATDAFRAVGTHTADGEVVFDYEGAVADDGSRYESFRSVEKHRERYQAEPGAPIYVRHELPESTADSVRESVERDEDRRLLRETGAADGGDRVRLVYVREDRRDVAPEVSSTATFLLGIPGTFLAFERASGAGDRTVYEPRGGWFAADQGGFRTTDARGELVVDASRNLTRSADLRWRTSGSATNYLEDLAREDVRYELTYELREDEVTVERPEWVDELREEQ